MAGADVSAALSERHAGRVTHDRELDTLHYRGCRFGPRRFGLAHHPGAQSGAGGPGGTLSAGRGTQFASRVRDSRPPCACRPDGRALRELGQTSARAGVLAGRGGQRRGHKRAYLGAAAAKRFGQDTAVVFPGPARGACRPSLAHRKRERRPSRRTGRVFGWGDPAGSVAPQAGPGCQGVATRRMITGVWCMYGWRPSR